MVLTQDKLDVKNKSRSNLFNWRGQFTPEFVEYMLEKFTSKGDKVLDPFAGSGTVLQECARRDLSAIGYEINPAANKMANFFTFCNLNREKRTNFLTKFELKFMAAVSALNGQRLFIENPDYRKAYENLLNFGVAFGGQLKNKNEEIFFLNILFSSEKDKALTLRQSLTKSFDYHKVALLNLPFTKNEIISELGDARSVGQNLENQIDFIITSPPYINVFNYHQNYRAIVEAFKFDILKVAHSEFGSNRKNRGNRFKTVIQYCLDMELSIKSFWKALKPGARMVLVVGRESNVRSTPFYNGKMVIEILEKSEGFSEISTAERQFTNKFGNNIKEDIIIAVKSKTNLIADEFFAKDIALSHLKRGLKSNKGEILSDIENAINEIDLVTPSPLFNPNTILNGR